MAIRMGESIVAAAGSKQMVRRLGCAIGRNRIMDSLPQQELERLQIRTESVFLSVEEKLEEPGKSIEHVYFPLYGMASIVAQMPDEHSVEIGVIGNEGMTGVAVIHGTDSSPYTTCVQIAGPAVRIKADDVRLAMEASPPVRSVFLRYAQAMLVQIASTALVNRHSTIEERLARWICMADDRLQTEELTLTHEFLALVLGVRRAGVTVALHELEGMGLIRSTRGRLKILDRAGLERKASGAYGECETEYERLLTA